MKRMHHPDHGWHHAYSPQEEAAMRQNGWLDDETPSAEPEPVVEAEVVTKRGPGRPRKQE